MNLLALIPALPLLSAVLLLVSAGRLPKRWVSLLGAGSIGLAAMCVARLSVDFFDDGQVRTLLLWTWMQVGSFNAEIAFYVDGLTLVMLSVITGVGFLIHLYSLEFMADDASFSRYFAYMNLFVAAMLLLVMADNLLLLYLGWEGVGLCSYLLVGFWYQDPNNGKAARKAFVMTRVGDAAMMLGLLLLWTELGTVNIQQLVAAATAHWPVGSSLPVLASALLLAGAVGKSAQLPLHTWLPDAMAGPTPVSALIHAATMVTAGVYLIARCHGLFLLAPAVLHAVAWIGVATLLLAAFSALVQKDIKRILAYSTISQIGYMFLALGVSAFSAGIFHLVTHAFFKALLFLSAGAVIHCLHHQHNIFKMGGLRRRLPLVFWSFMIGSAALAALPFSSGFYSKDAILLSAWSLPTIGPWLFFAALLGALLTAIYSFRLVFLVFFGPAKLEPDKQLGWKMSLPLLLLCVLSLLGGYLTLPVDNVFINVAGEGSSTNKPPHAIEIIAIATPLVGLCIAYVLFLGRQISIVSISEAVIGQRLQKFFHQGWRIDGLYQQLFITPFNKLASLWRNEPLDAIARSIIALAQYLHHQLSALQTGQLRSYVGSMVLGLVVLLALILRYFL